jgi:hypothetical protein
LLIIFARRSHGLFNPGQIFMRAARVLLASRGALDLDLYRLSFSFACPCFCCYVFPARHRFSAPTIFSRPHALRQTRS